MKIAIFSDVHANLPALEAVYKHIVAQQPDAVYCLGDLVNQNVWNNEVVEFISGHQIPCVRGNHDEGIGNNQIRFPFSYGGQDEMAWGLEAIKYTLADVTEQHKNYLKQLHLKLKVRVETGGHLRTIVFAHGTPSSNTERIYRFYKQDELSKILENEKADVLLIGNTHTSFHKIICVQQTGCNIYYHIINPGSVGYPKDGSWHACYAIISIDRSKDIKYDGDALQVEFFRLDYDINKTIRAIQQSGLPVYYAGRLLKY